MMVIISKCTKIFLFPSCFHSFIHSFNEINIRTSKHKHTHPIHSKWKKKIFPVLVSHHHYWFGFFPHTHTHTHTFLSIQNGPTWSTDRLTDWLTDWSTKMLKLWRNNTIKHETQTTLLTMMMMMISTITTKYLEIIRAVPGKISKKKKQLMFSFQRWWWWWWLPHKHTKNTRPDNLFSRICSYFFFYSDIHQIKQLEIRVCVCVFVCMSNPGKILKKKSESEYTRQRQQKKTEHETK